MRLLALHVQDFRNLGQVTLSPSVHASIAVGQNGQGKTNLLEALYFLATLKPLRAGRLSELVRWGSPSARVMGRFLLKGAEREISVEVAGGVRQAFVDGKKAASLEEYFGGVSVVAFTPDDLEVVKGGPESRRAFLDRAVFNRFPAFLRESREYARALKNRNRLLKSGPVDAAYLEAYDETLAKTGARVYARRRALMAELAPRAQATFASIGRTPEPAAYRYHPAHLGDVDFSGADEAALAVALKEALAARSRRDLDRGFTSVGPHVDDVTVTLGARSARAYASQGQQRALVLGWKIAEIENLEAAMGFLPLLLLDDVSSELDPERNAYLMNYLAASGAQVFLTTTDAGLVRGAAAQDTLWLGVRTGAVTSVAPLQEPPALAQHADESA
ncbi:DNA replication/repair protein RecF [Archangium gephyra]|nr:DNA replication/repair protein RecF [Archangium gephyra]